MPASRKPRRIPSAHGRAAGASGRPHAAGARARPAEGRARGATGRDAVRAKTEGARREVRQTPTTSAKSVVEEIRATAKRGRAEEALQAFDRAVALMERDRDAQAVAAAEEAKTMAPRSGVVREVLGLALYRVGRFRDSLRELQAYRRISGRVDQNHLMADCLRAVGRPEQAVPLVQEVLRARVPEEVRAEATVVGAAALGDLGRFEEGLGLLRSHRSRPGESRDADLRIWYVTGDLLARMGRRQEAVAEFRRVLRHDRAAFDAAERLADLGG